MGGRERNACIKDKEGLALTLASVSGMLRSGAENTYTADTAPDRQAVFLYLLNALKFEAVR